METLLKSFAIIFAVLAVICLIVTVMGHYQHIITTVICFVMFLVLNEENTKKPTL